MGGVDVMVRSLFTIGIILQFTFLILYFSAILSKMNNVGGAILCLFLSLTSLMVGVLILKYHTNKLSSLPIILTGFFMLMFTLVTYFLGEAGYPPLILMNSLLYTRRIFK